MARLKRRGSIWYAWIPKPEGGTRLVSTNCTDKEAARGRAKELERSAVDPVHSAANKAAFADSCAAFLDSRRARNRAPETLQHYGVKLRHLIRLLPARLAEHSHAEGEKYIATRRDEGAKQTTVKKELRAWGAVLKLAYKNDLLETHPDKIVPELEDTYVPGDRALAPWEMMALALVLPPRRMAIIAFSVATGAELRAIERARRVDVADDFSIVHLRGTKRSTRKREVPIPPGIRRTLLAWAVRHADGIELLFAPWASMRRDVTNASKKIGIPSSSPNDWRRTFGTWLRNGGVEPQLIGAALGHKDSRMAERVYAKLAPAELAKLLETRLLAGPEGVSPAHPTVQLMSGEADIVSASPGGTDSAISAENSEIVVPRDGIEPPTRGFSIRGDASENYANSALSVEGCRANVESLSGVSSEEAADEPPSGEAAHHALSGDSDGQKSLSPALAKCASGLAAQRAVGDELDAFVTAAEGIAAEPRRAKGGRS